MIQSSVQLSGESVSRETFDRLEEFAGLVRRWTSAINLVSRSSLEDLWNRHIVDSVQVFRMAASAAHWVDLGSGGGFPGIVVAILARESAPELRMTLVESDLRKATFLRQASSSLGLSVAVIGKRIEDVPPLQADVLSARALAPLPSLLPFAKLHMRAEGVAIFPKGRRHQEEISEARRDWSFDVDSRPSQSEPGAAILMIRNIVRAKND